MNIQNVYNKAARYDDIAIRYPVVQVPEHDFSKEKCSIDGCRNSTSKRLVLTMRATEESETINLCAAHSAESAKTLTKIITNKWKGKL